MNAQRVMPSSRLHDDSEEDLVGADWHQTAIRALVDSLHDLAEERNLPWHVGDQLTLVAAKPDGTAWRPSPDVMIYPHAGRDKRAEMVVRTDGVPALIVEVASRSTWEYDVDARSGKAWGYLQVGVPNYLVFDPQGDWLGQQCRGWQQEDGKIRDWIPEADGRYHALLLNISFRPESDLLRVFGPDGQPVAFGFEKAQRIREQAQRIAALESELVRLRRQT